MSTSAWPDWGGQAVAIIASGPSVKAADVAALEGRLPVVAIKKNVELAPFAAAVYGCDLPWWRSVRGLPDYNGLKLAYDRVACDQFGCRKVDIPDARDNALRFDRVGEVGAGGNSGFQALNLAAQFGAARILLIGFDAQVRSGVHWYGRNTAYKMSNPDAGNCDRWRAAFDAAAPVLEARGVEVVNASPISAIAGFARAPGDVTLQRWGL